LGEGSAEIESIVRLLTDSGYGGWFVIEQDLVIGGHIDASGPMENATRSVQFLQRVALA
jgi:inosose dehydratase